MILRPLSITLQPFLSIFPFLSCPEGDISLHHSRINCEESKGFKLKLHAERMLMMRIAT